MGNSRAKLGITGTFLDEITHDIPSQNWGVKEWARDFDAMAAVGIDTVILIRAGYRHMATFPSQVLQDRVGILPVRKDLVQLFLDQAQRHGMSFYFGTYDSGDHWMRGAYQEEVDLNRAFCDEVGTRYASHPAFAGWYISHEINVFDDGMMGVYEKLASHLRGIAKVPILMSPYIKGIKQFGQQAIGLNQHIKEWESVFSRLQGHVDIVAFQDGNVELAELPHYLEANRSLAARYGLSSWSNVETFDRDMPIKFPPIDYRKLLHKMEQATKAGMEKLITFEFSHFMSPHSIYPAAGHLYERYREWLGVTDEA